jgi:hypothetical protein
MTRTSAKSFSAALELIWMSLSGKIINSFRDESIDAKVEYSTLWRSLDKKVSRPLSRKHLYSMLQELLQISLDRLFEVKDRTLRLLVGNIEIMLDEISEVIREDDGTITVSGVPTVQSLF